MTVTSRPHRLTRVAWGVAVFVLIGFGVVSWALGQDPEAQFRLPDQLAMFGLGVLLAAAVLSFTRCRVDADEAGVTVRNLLGDKRLPWQVVREVRLDDGAPWAVLDLQDDETVQLLGVQTNDGDRAVDVVLGLRRLLAESRTPR